MSDEIKRGDHVEWNTSQGTTSGIVEKKLTDRTSIKGHEVAATKDDPQFVVRSDKTDAKAAHKPEALEKTDE